MRLLITGKTRSGKSTALHRLCADLLKRKWRHVLILDGKGTELHPYSHLHFVEYYGPTQISNWADALADLAEEMDNRFAALIEQGKVKADEGTLATLIIADEIQKGTRATRPHGKSIKDALTTMAEQSAALGDVIILGCQRLQTAVPPNVRENANASLRMLGKGYFQLAADGRKSRAGRVAFTTSTIALDLIGQGKTDNQLPLTPEALPDILNATVPAPRDGKSTLYLGEMGSGRSHALHHHPTGTAERVIYADLAHSHKQFLTTIIEEAGAVLPPKATITDLAEIAAIALTADPTLLLLDNAEQASEKCRASIQMLMTAAHETAVGALDPQTATHEKRLSYLIPRCEITQLKPLDVTAARKLAAANLPDRVDQRETAVGRIVDLAQGHPATIVSMARRTQNGSLAELREYRTSSRPFPLGWVILVLAAAMLMAARRDIDSYWMLVIAFAVYIVVRPLIYKAMRP